MLLSYNFLIYYTLTSATFLLKDIFLKDNCEVKYTDTQIISNYKKASPIVFRNLLAFLKTLLSFDIYLTIFGSDYSYVWSVVYIWIGYYVFLLLTNIVFDLNKFNMIDSRNNLKTKDALEVDGPFFILYVDPVKFSSVIKPLSLLGWFFMINEYVMIYFIVMSYIIMVLDCCNIAGSEMKTFRESFNEQRKKIDDKLFFLSNNITDLKNNRFLVSLYSGLNNVRNKFSKKKEHSEEYVNIIKLDDLSNTSSNIHNIEDTIEDNIEYVMSKNSELLMNNDVQVANEISEGIDRDQTETNEPQDELETNEQPEELETNEPQDEINANQQSSVQVVDVEIQNN